MEASMPASPPTWPSPATVEQGKPVKSGDAPASNIREKSRSTTFLSIASGWTMASKSSRPKRSTRRKGDEETRGAEWK